MRLLNKTFTIAIISVLCVNATGIYAQQQVAKAHFVGYTETEGESGWYEDADASPLDVMNFHAEMLNDAVELFWETRIEGKIAGYEIERSLNGGIFEGIAWVPAIGEDNIGGAYLHLDEDNSINRTLYYRIKAINNDGRYEYSEVQIVDAQESHIIIDLSADLTTQPNKLIIDKREIDPSRKVQLRNAEGKILRSAHITENKVDLNLAKFKTGVFFVEIPIFDDEVRLERVVQQ